MGIQGLLPFVEKACRPCSLKEFRGRTIAVDACCWLHKGAFGCAPELARGQQTDFYVQYCMKYVKSLLSHGISKVILVFDGAKLPAKKQTNETRKEKRDLAREKGHRSLAEGNHAEANSFFRQGMGITSEMISDVIQACNGLGRSDVECIVAPYEADAQLTYLNVNGFADVVLSEDSDLIVFGCKKIIFKSDQFSGVLFESEKLLPAVFGHLHSKFSFTLFRRICILSGCDYADGLQGFGLTTAAKFFRKVASSSSRDIRACLRRIPIVMNKSGIAITDEFIDQFVAAENTFLYQLVYDPELQRLIPLNPYPEGVDAESMPYAGNLLDDDIAAGIANGILCPYSHKRRPQSVQTGRSDLTQHKAIKRPSPKKSPAKSPQKSTNSQPRTAFEIGHTRNVVRAPKSAQKKVPSDLSFEKSTALAIYDSGNDESSTRSRYFASQTQMNITKTPTATQAPRKRSLFDTLDNTGYDGEEESEDSGFYDSSSPSFASTPISNSSAKKAAWSKTYSFRSSSSQESNGPGASPLLTAFTGMFSQFQYVRGGASQDSGAN